MGVEPDREEEADEVVARQAHTRTRTKHTDTRRDEAEALSLREGS